MSRKIVGATVTTPFNPNNIQGGGDGGSGATITVDSELSETSTNPVQNKVVTKKINEINTTVGNVDALLQTI